MGSFRFSRPSFISGGEFRTTRRIVGLALAIALGLTLLSCDYASAVPILSPDKTKVADAVDDRIYLERVSDGNQQVLVRNPNYSIDSLKWSPDGTKLLYLEQPKRKRIQQSSVRWRVIDVNDPRRESHVLTVPGDGYVNDPVWSPKSDRLAFYSTSDGHQSHFLWVIGADGKDALRLCDQGDARYPKWSADGESLAFATDLGVSVIRANGQGQREVAEMPRGTHTFVDGWSPDGKMVAFGNQAAGSNDRDIWVVDVSTRDLAVTSENDKPRNLTSSEQPGTYNLRPVWAPDSRRIAYTSERGETTALCVIDLGGTNRELIKHQPVHLDVKEWSPDGETIGYSRDDPDRDTGADEFWLVGADSQAAANGEVAVDGEVTADSKSAARKLSGGGAEWAGWFWDKNQVNTAATAKLFFLGENEETRALEVWVAEKDGSSPRSLKKDLAKLDESRGGIQQKAKKLIDRMSDEELLELELDMSRGAILNKVRKHINNASVEELSRVGILEKAKSLIDGMSEDELAALKIDKSGGASLRNLKDLVLEKANGLVNGMSEKELSELEFEMSRRVVLPKVKVLIQEKAKDIVTGMSEEELPELELETFSDVILQKAKNLMGEKEFSKLELEMFHGVILRKVKDLIDGVSKEDLSAVTNSSPKEKVRTKNQLEFDWARTDLFLLKSSLDRLQSINTRQRGNDDGQLRMNGVPIPADIYRRIAYYADGTFFEHYLANLALRTIRDMARLSQSKRIGLENKKLLDRLQRCKAGFERCNESQDMQAFPQLFLEQMKIMNELQFLEATAQEISDRYSIGS